MFNAIRLLIGLLALYVAPVFAGGFPYPTGAQPGFDPHHIAAGGIVRYSSVALNGNMLNLLTGQRGTTPGTAPTYSVLNFLGPNTRFVTATSTQVVADAGHPTAVDTSYTMAVIWMGTVNSTSQYLLSNAASGSTGMALNIGPTNVLRLIPLGQVTTATSTITLLSNVPYLFVASNNGTTNTNFVIVRLDTGQIYSESISSISASVGPVSGTYAVGNQTSVGSATTPARGGIAAAMITNQYNTIPTILAWVAKDPWSFWYQNPTRRGLAN